MRKKFVLSLSLGILLGIGASFGDTISWSMPAVATSFGILNTASVWSLLGFFNGLMFKNKRVSILAAVLSLILAVFSYYVYGYLFGNRSSIPALYLARFAGFWGFLAVIIGVLTGLAANYVKNGKLIQLKLVATCIPSIIILSEIGVRITQLLPYFNNNADNAYILFVYLILCFVALIIPWIILKNEKFALISNLLSLGLSIFGVIGLNLIYKAQEIIS